MERAHRVRHCAAIREGALDRLEEAVQVTKGLPSEDLFSFTGQHYRIANTPMNPVRPDMDLLIGGGGE